MTIENKNILNIEYGIICHQVNCFGTTAGLSKEIMKKYPEVKHEYNAVINHVEEKDRWTLLGLCQIVDTKQETVAVANIFSQYDIYFQYDTFMNCRTMEYAALKGALKYLAEEVKEDVPIYFPHKFACDFSGGDWEIVQNMIKHYLSNHKYIICDP